MSIAIIDAYNYKKNLKEAKEYIDDYLKSSGLVVLSKSEQLSEDDFLEIKQNLNIGENINFPLCHYSKWSEEQWKNIFDSKLVVDKNKNSSILKFEIDRPIERKFEQISLKDIAIGSIGELSNILLYLMSGRLGNIDRVKGYLTINNQCLKFDLVGENYIITGYEDKEDNKVIVIGDNLDKERLFGLFKVV